MQDLPSYIPPGGLFDDRGQFRFDPNGPVGNLVVPGYDRPVTLGELVQQRDFPHFGAEWIIDPSQGTAVPSYSPSPLEIMGMQAAMAAAQANNQRSNDELLLLLLL